MNARKKHLAELERHVRFMTGGDVWIEGENETVRIDTRGKRGNTINFPTCYEARVWIEKQINSHAGGLISYSISHVADLNANSAALRAALLQILPGQIVVPQTTGRAVAGVIEPLVFDATDHFGGDLAMGRIPTSGPADVRLWCLAELIARYFGGLQFKARHLAGQHTDDDQTMYAALLAVFAWQRPDTPAQIESDFSQLVTQAARLAPRENSRAGNAPLD